MLLLSEFYSLKFKAHAVDSLNIIPEILRTIYQNLQSYKRFYMFVYIDSTRPLPVLLNVELIRWTGRHSDF